MDFCEIKIARLDWARTFGASAGVRGGAADRQGIEAGGVDERMVAYASCGIAEQRRLMAACAGGSPLYLTGSRAVARAARRAGAGPLRNVTTLRSKEKREGRARTNSTNVAPEHSCGTT